MLTLVAILSQKIRPHSHHMVAVVGKLIIVMRLGRLKVRFGNPTWHF